MWIKRIHTLYAMQQNGFTIFLIDGDSNRFLNLLISGIKKSIRFYDINTQLSIDGCISIQNFETIVSVCRCYLLIMISVNNFPKKITKILYLLTLVRPLISFFFNFLYKNRLIFSTYSTIWNGFINKFFKKLINFF